jgi:RNA polymerase sigma factor (sigma-70 family)
VNLAPETFAMDFDRFEIHELFEAERDRVFRLLYRLTGNAANADDLLQDTFLTAWRKWRQFDGRGSASGWLQSIAFRLFLNSCNRDIRRGRLAKQVRLVRDPREPGDSSVAQLDSQEATQIMLARVRASLLRLPEGPREAFALVRLGGLSVSEVAVLARVPPKTVENRLRRATQLLADTLADLKGDLA